MTFHDPAQTLVVDTECYPNFWCIGFRRVSDGKTLVIEHSSRKPMTDQQRDRIRNLLWNNTIITYNGQNYDMPMIYKAIDGASNAELKAANDSIIVGKMKYWQAEDVLGVVVPRDVFIRKDGTKSDGLDHIDLLGPCPAPPTKTGGESFPVGLKTLQGRLHGRQMRDLPYPADQNLTEAQMDEVISYMGNDLIATHSVFDALLEPLALRFAFSQEYGVNLMSKSDAQMGEAIIKKRVEQETGEKKYKVETPGGTTFKFKAPEYLQFDQGSELASIFQRTLAFDFMVQHNGKVELPAWLSDNLIHIGESSYQMGIGGLHSTEKNRSVHADDDYALVDVDVGSYYPAIIINSGLYPRALGPAFLSVFRKIRDERIGAKGRVKEIDLELKAGTSLGTAALMAERTKFLAIVEGLKIALNGCFGKLGSPYSVLYAPHLLITTTLTGQFALLMLIQRAEKMGISVVSANTDGIVMKIPRHMMGPVVKDRITGRAAKDLIEQWEADTGFVMEATEYQSLYNRSVNDYIAVKPDGTVKCKGVNANPWRSDEGFKPDQRGQLSKNPQMPILANAVVDLITKDVPIEDTIRAARDVRDYVTVVKVQGGATWTPEPDTETRVRTDGATYSEKYEQVTGLSKGEYLGKVVRYYWSKNGATIFRAKAHESTGNFGQVSKSEGSRPLMEMDGEFPADLDFDHYIAEAKEILMDIGYYTRPPKVKPVRVYKYNAIAWFALAA